VSNDNLNVNNPATEPSSQGHNSSQKPHGGVFGDVAPVVEFAAHQVAHQWMEEGKGHQETAESYRANGEYAAAAKEEALGTVKTAGAFGGMTAVGWAAGWAPWVVATGGWIVVGVVVVGGISVGVSVYQAATKKPSANNTNS
jgi:hypothetical protein